MSNNKKAIIIVSSVILCAVAVVGIIFGIAFNGKNGSIVLNDSQGEAFATVLWDGYDITYSVEMDYEKEYAVYVIDETQEILAKNKKISDNDIVEYLFENVTAINTNYNSEIQLSLKEAYSENSELDGVPCAMAVTDLNGKVLAIFSGGSDENLSLNKTYAGSTIKPLSVYAPAVDNGYIWSYSLTDSPVKKVQEQDGSLVDWPANSDGEYTHENVCIADALTFSTNTIAVKLLKEIGVTNAVSVLDEKYGIDVEFEKEKMITSGEDEVLGNVALGYLYNGVTVTDMAGYYQVFANGGNYITASSVNEVIGEGDIIYKNEYIEKRVMKKETADIMNKMLQRVVSVGTGETAKVSKVNVAGKTGTTTGNADNWFAGVTPEYSCAVWHGKADEGNIAPKVFGSVFEKIESTVEDFSCDSVIEARLYCEKSGLLRGEKCIYCNKGYYLKSQTIEKCEKCE